MIISEKHDLYTLSTPMTLGVMARCKYIIKKPADCLLAELFHFYLLLKKGNKVSTKDLSQKIHNCEFLAFCYLENRLVGISAIKRPAQSYIEEVHRKAGVWRNIEEYIFEVGYSFTEDDVRRLGISRTLKQMLQKKIIHHHGMVFSTTAVQTSQRFLKSQGFVACGKPYQGKYDDNIIYFEKRI